MLKRLTSWLLYYANSDPPPMARQEFYALKTRLLQRYGMADGTDIQWIVKHCWNCEARGRKDPYCWKCGGSGVYEQFWVVLVRWNLGGRVFHVPGPRRHGKPPVEYAVNIHGYVQHAWHGKVSREAQLWLALLFDRPLFWRLLTSSCYCGWSWWPMLVLQSLVVNGRWTLDRIYNAVRVRICEDCGKRFMVLGNRELWQRCRACNDALKARLDEQGLPF